MQYDIPPESLRARFFNEEIEASALCGCFHCLAIYPPSSIVEWVDWPDDTPLERQRTAGHTALCPRCGVDSVIGSASGYPIDTDLLKAMHKYWFS